MEALRLTLLEVIAKDREARFVIPKWQRHYVWGEKEISQMWGDWWADCDKGEKHFCGVMLFQRLNTSPTLTMEIVDGQQRMTTFFLFFVALRDVCEEKGIDFSALEDIFTLPGKQECRLVLLEGFNEDRDVLNALLGRTTDRLDKDILEESVLNKGYRIFRQKLADLDETKIISFVQNVLEYVDFVVLTVDPEDNPRRIFEALNSRGKQVNQQELVANLIRFAGDADEDLKDLARDTWGSICHWFEEEEILQFLDAFSKRNGANNDRASIFDVIRNEVDRAKEEQRLKQWLKEFSRAGENYHDVLYPQYSDDVTRSLLVELQRLKVGKLNPFLLALLETFRNTPASEPLIHNVVAAVVRMLIAFERPSYKLEKFAAEACFAFHEKNISRVDQLAKVIKLIDGIWISDDVFHKAFTTKTVYGPGAHLSRLRYYLEKFEQRIAEEKGMPFEIHFGNQTTIEHIMPQKLDEGGAWKSALRTNDAVRLESQHRALVHTIGNLTVLLTSDNPAAGNTPYSNKREFYLHPNDYLNRHGGRKRKIVIGTCSLNSYFEDVPVWNFQTIAARSSKLADLAVSIWNKESWNMETVTK